MGIASQYRQKLVEAEEAVKTVGSGDWVDYGHWNSTPAWLDAALGKRVGELRDVKIRTAGFFPGMSATVTADPDQESFTYHSCFFSTADRKLHDQGRAIR